MCESVWVNGGEVVKIAAKFLTKWFCGCCNYEFMCTVPAPTGNALEEIGEGMK